MSQAAGPTVAILHVRGMNDGVQQQTQRIYENVALLALDLLARIIAMRIDSGPPFSALFTLWLSMIESTLFNQSWRLKIRAAPSERAVCARAKNTRSIWPLFRAVTWQS
jgi:hypothetical protein